MFFAQQNYLGNTIRGRGVDTNPPRGFGLIRHWKHSCHTNFKNCRQQLSHHIVNSLFNISTKPRGVAQPTSTPHPPPTCTSEGEVILTMRSINFVDCKLITVELFDSGNIFEINPKAFVHVCGLVHLDIERAYGSDTRAQFSAEFGSPTDCSIRTVVCIFLRLHWGKVCWFGCRWPILQLLQTICGQPTGS